MALSFSSVGGIGWIVGSCAVGFLSATILARFLSRRFLRNYFALTGIRVPRLDAQHIGEGQQVEFKRSLSDDVSRSGAVDDELLKSVAAFANTNDGVIFIGVDDAGHIKGLGLDFKQRDKLEQKVSQLIRTRIRPVPPFRVTLRTCAGL